MIRRIFLNLSALALVTLLCLAPASGQESKDPADPVIVERLDKILKRLDVIVRQLAEPQITRIAPRPWRVSSSGLIRDSAGRPIGFWGIDSAPSTTQARR